METVQSIRASLQQFEWVVKLDLKDAFLHLPVLPTIRKYFRFVIADTVYQF